MYKTPPSAAISENGRITTQFTAAKGTRVQQLPTARSKDAAVRKQNLQQQSTFKYNHGLLVGLLLSFVYLHGVGIFLFTKGFLLTRLVLHQKSTCDISPLQEYAQHGPAWVGDIDEGCWHPKTFDKAVIVVIDALRFDFTVPFEPKDNSTPTHLFHNAFTTPYRTSSENPKNAVLLPFIADPPTTTLQRLKGLTTGTLPTFIDAGSNFAGNAVEEDNLISQLNALGKRIAFMGDDTWIALFPGMFEPEMEHPYESLNVWDLHTVDNGVSEHIFPLLRPENQNKWDIAIGHYLGVDHAGHRYGPDHFAMAEKLKQMDEVVRRLMEGIDDNTLLVVMGDHGMDPKGDHGGESQGEVEAALWLYSKKPVFGSFPKELPPNGGGRGAGSDGMRSVAQIDLVPTLSLLLGIPIPFNNLGAPIVEAFVGDGEAEGFHNLAQVSRLTAAQIKRYQKEYAGGGGEMESDAVKWEQGQSKWEKYHGKRQKTNRLEWMSVFHDFSAYQENILKACREVWASFDLFSMAAGITVLAGSVAALAVYARCFAGDRVELTHVLISQMFQGLSAGAIGSIITGYLVDEDALPLSRVRLMLFGTSIGAILGFFSATIHARSRLTTIWPTSGWGILSVVFTITHSLTFSSNSFTIWESQILGYFLSTFAIGGLIASQRNQDLTQRMLGTYHSVIFFFLTRIASFSKLCREEQMPYCKSTFYASATSSVSAPWSLAILFVMAIILPSIIKSFYSGSKSYHGPAPVTIGWAFRAGLVLSALYWLLDSADNGGWFEVPESFLKSSKTMIAQIVLGMGLFAGSVAYGWTSLCLGVEIEDKKTEAIGTDGTITSESGKTVLLLGYANVHGSRYFLLVISWALALILLQKPMGGASMGILLWQVLSLLEIIDCNDLSDSAIGPIILGLLGNSHFFSTGHQATLSSIQWESAFIPFTSIRYPWSPLLVIGNTVGPQILAALAVPLVALWKAPPKRAGLLGSVAVAGATHMLYHAVTALSSVVCAGHLRRHLMLYRIFSPRFMLGAAVLLIVDVVVALVAVGGVRWNGLAVAEIFGI